MIKVPAFETGLIGGPSRIAREAVRVALGEIGKGEEGGNNRGPNVERYRRGSRVKAKRYDGDGAWCAAFVSYCFAQGALPDDLPFKPSWGAKRLYKNIGRAGEFAKMPQVGDVACWDRGARGSWQGHIGIVVSVDGVEFVTVEGNRGRFPSRVRKYDHDVGEGRLVGFARI